jgi:RNA polymerase sigma-70 factor (ECF subfamily)
MTDGTTAKPLSRAEIGDLDDRFRIPLLRYFLRRVGVLADAEDLVQEVFVGLLKRAPGDRILNSGAFVYAAAGNLLRDRARRLRSRPSAPPGDAETAESQGPVEDFTPERVLISKERLSEVLACLDELPPKTRDAFLLFRLERMKQGEIARALGLSVSAVEKHVARAVAHLAQRFGATPSGRRDDGA